MSVTKREAVLRAATALFSRHGVRKTSMDQIAREAQVAKPTIYVYFKDKDALYAAVCESVGEGIVAQARAAAAVAGSLPARVAAVLAAKFTAVHELIDASPYAHELLNAHNAQAKHSIEAANSAFRVVLSEVIEGAVGQKELDLRGAGLTVPDLVQQLMQVGHGAGYGAATASQQRDNLSALVATHLRSVVRPGRASQQRRKR
jgi:AcrR family transcriptional regulator